MGVKYQRGLQIHHDFYVQREREGKLEPGDEAQLAMAMEREKNGKVQPLVMPETSSENPPVEPISNS